MRVLLAVPHADITTPAGDKGSLEMANKLAKYIKGAVVLESKAMRVVGQTDSNRGNNPIQTPKLTEFHSTLKTKLDLNPRLMLDIHSYGTRPHQFIHGTPDVYAMHFPNDEVQIEIAKNLGIDQMIEASDKNYDISQANQMGVPSLLLAFHEDAYTKKEFVQELAEKINTYVSKTPWPGD